MLQDLIDSRALDKIYRIYSLRRVAIEAVMSNDYRKDNDHYYLCETCNEWTETEDEMSEHIVLYHNPTGLKEAIDDTFEKFPFKIRDLYEEIESLIKNVLNEKTASIIYKEVLSISIERILVMIREEHNELHEFLNRDLKCLCRNLYSVI